MDPFTKRMLEKAEQRSKARGISKGTKFPLSESDQQLPSNINISKQKADISNSDTSSTPSKVQRHYSVDKENCDVGIEINITTGPDVEVQVQVAEQDIVDDGKKIKKESSTLQPLATIRDSSRNRLQRLGELYSDTSSLSSPIHRTEGKFHEESNTTESRAGRPKQKFGKLAALADSIKNWEDDTSHSDYKDKRTVTQASSQTKTDNLKETQISKGSESQNSETSQTKQIVWDKNVIDSLEAQGFQRRESSNSKIQYDYKINGETQSNSSKKQVEIKEKQNQFKQNSPKISNIRSGLVSGRAAAFETRAVNSPTRPQKDPAEMSLKERMMLFERNKGKALIPKAPFSMPVPANKIQIDTNKYIQKDKYKELPKDFPITDVKVKEKVAALTSGGITISESNIKSDISKQKQEDMNIIANRFNRPKLRSQSENESFSTSVSSMKSPPPPPPFILKTHSKPEHIEAKCTITNKRRSPAHRTNQTDTTISDDVKRIKVNPIKKSGRLYPVLSDIETTASENGNYTTATMSSSSSNTDKRSNNDEYEKNEFNESYMDSEDSSADICNLSLGREIMQAVETNEKLKSDIVKQVRYADPQTEIHYESSLNSTVTSDISGEMDDYLDEAFEEDDSEAENQFHEPSKNQQHGTKCSNSFSYKREPMRQIKYSSISEETDNYSVKTEDKYRNPVKSALTVEPSNDNDVVTLVHTVSFYRRQQSSNSNNSTPVRKIIREEVTQSNGKTTTESSDEDYSNETDDTQIVQEKITKLLDEICKQQQVIAQTSQALNLCASTVEFSGSLESVEGERHLLVAIHRRQAALDEVQRLRVEGTLRPHGAPKEKGRLSVKDITLPLKRSYIEKLAANDIDGHHLVCLLKYNQHVIATQSMPTMPGLKSIKFQDVLQLNDVYADFKVTMEIYGMTAHHQAIPHEVKYHIYNKKSGSKTPKKKGSDSRLIMPPTQSPAGPNVVRTPTLALYGFAIFSLREIQRTSWTLTKVLDCCPLDGLLHMKVNCELTVSVEYRGFLTMYEDISGFGAWHRRWCFLNGPILNYWKYPDDENKKAPLGTIELYSCCSSKVTTAPRDVCARLNTLLLECQRPVKDTDFESFLIKPKGKVTVIRYLLSADTKEERDDWSAHFNKSLALIRAWGSSKQ